MRVIREDERREYRRKRRRRNQLLAYLFLLILLTGLVGGVMTGLRRAQREEEQKTQDNLTEVEALLESEQPLVVLPAEPEDEQPSGPTPEELLEQKITDHLSVMTQEEKVAGLFIVAPEAITGVTAAVRAQEGTKDALDRYPVGGLVYFAKNIQSHDQLKGMLANTRAYSKYPLFIAVDEEGGTVSRIAGSGLAPMSDPPAKIGQSGDPGKAYEAGLTIGGYLKELGFDLNFAPVADLATVENSVMAERSYGSEPTAVSSYVTSMMKGLSEQGITACLKHFPGIGSTVADTHQGLAVSDRTAQEFKDHELAVFLDGIEAGAQMIMVGHMAAPALTGDNTASLAGTVVTDLLRQELNYQGIIITDGLNMSAISQYYESDQAAILALKAGCDMLLMPEDFEKAYEGVLQAVKDGVISEERINDSLRRIYRVKWDPAR